MNIVSMAMNFMGPAVIDRIARSLGINSTLARTAISTALPAIMAAMAGKGASAQGAGSILDMVRDKGASGLDNLETMFGGADEAQRIDAGHRDLATTLGNGEMGPIMQAVSRFTGIEEQKSNALLGMMAPVAMGTIGEEVSKQNLDADGLSRFLSGQRSNIADALPDGFVDNVSGSASFDAFRSNFMGTDTMGREAVAQVGGGQHPANTDRVATGTIGTAETGTAGAGTSPVGTGPVGHGETVERVTTHADTVDTPTARKSGGMLGWLIGLLALLAIGWYVFTNFISPSDVDAPAGIEQSLGQSEIGSELSQSVQNIQSSLGSITDEDSARAALPDLTAASENLGSVQEMAGNLPDAQRGALGGIVTNAMKTLEPMIEKVRAIPGVGAIVGPVLDGIVEKMNDLG